MRVITASEFGGNAVGVLRSRGPVLVTRRGRLAGVFFPHTEASLPIAFKRGLFGALSGEIARQVARRRLAEKDVLEDFARWRKARRRPARQR
jgi:hypothetical protein